jgi:predicted phosphodiesterase
MKYLVLSDVHGRDLEPMQAVVKQEQFDTFLFLGDLDLMRSIRQVKALADRFEAEYDGAVLVPGNHDHALYAGLDIASGTLREQGTNMHMLRRELDHTPELETFLDDLVAGRDPGTPTPHSKTLGMDGFDAVLVHGGLTGSLRSYPGCPSTIHDLWYRLRSETQYRETFTAMDRQGFDLVLRGHDHTPGLTTERNWRIETFRVTGAEEHILEPGTRYVLTAGAYCDGWYTTLETSEKQVRVRFHTV